MYQAGVERLHSFGCDVELGVPYIVAGGAFVEVGVDGEFVFGDVEANPAIEAEIVSVERPVFGVDKDGAGGFPLLRQKVTLEHVAGGISPVRVHSDGEKRRIVGYRGNDGRRRWSADSRRRWDGCLLAEHVAHGYLCDERDRALSFYGGDRLAIAFRGPVYVEVVSG